MAEKWNPISRVRATNVQFELPWMWGPSPKLPPDLKVEQFRLNIDNDASTPVERFAGDTTKLGYLRYDVTSVAAQLRSGGTAASSALEADATR